MIPRWLDVDNSESSKSNNHKNKLVWVAKYKDGIEFSQYNDSIEQSSENINRTKLLILKLLDHEGKVIISQEYRSGQMPIYRRRTAIRIGEEIIDIIHILGWRMLVNDTFITHVAFIYESDFHIEMGEFRKNNESLSRYEEWQYPINFKDIDTIVVE